MKNKIRHIKSGGKKDNLTKTGYAVSRIDGC